MDGLTHAALGALVGEWLLGRKLGNRALALGAVVGLLPELDVLMVPFVDQARWLDWRDSVTHSLLMVTLVPIVLGRWLARRMTKPKLGANALGWPVAAILAAHVLVDCLGCRGRSGNVPFLQRKSFWHRKGQVKPHPLAERSRSPANIRFLQLAITKRYPPSTTMICFASMFCRICKPPAWIMAGLG